VDNTRATPIKLLKQLDHRPFEIEVRSDRWRDRGLAGQLNRLDYRHGSIELGLTSGKMEVLNPSELQATDRLHKTFSGIRQVPAA
jgi:hypothetical protein